MDRMKIGVVGCGDICSRTYIPNIASRFRNMTLHALCDLKTERAETLARKYDVPHVYTLEQMLADPEIDIILNTTTPQSHYAINMMALQAGKHVYTEKPLGLDLTEAQAQLDVANQRGLYIGCAPDVFLGAGVQTCRKALDDGRIGEIVGARAAIMYHGPEAVHPSPDFLYQKGAGPILDVGPYILHELLYFLGPVKELSCYGGIKTPNRPIKDRFVQVEVNTHINAILAFESGHSASVDMSWEVWGAVNGPRVQVFGKNGTLFLTDSDNYGAGCQVHILESKDMEDENGAITWEAMQKIGSYKKEVPLLFESPEENRGLGLSEMVDAIQNKRKNRANGEFATHLTELMDGMNIAIATGEPYRMRTTFDIPEPLPVDFLERVKE